MGWEALVASIIRILGLIKLSCGLVIVPAFVGSCRPLSADQSCGIYALYGAARVLEVNCELQPIVNDRFVSSWKGSTIQNLIVAAEELGVHATPLQRLGRATLESARDPMLLHVASYGQIASFNHWLLFIGMKEGKAQVLDETGEMVLIDLPLLMARWDGIAIAVHRDPKPMTRFAMVESLYFVFWVAQFLLLAFLIQCLASSLKPSRISISGIALTGCLLTLLFWPVPNFLNRQSLTAINYQTAAFGASSFSSISRTELIHLIQSKDTSLTQSPYLIVDARYPDDVAWLGTIPGAINLPVNIGDKKLLERVGTTPLDSEVIVFCLSRRCRYAEIVAIRLTGLGFTKIRVYQPGWYGCIEGEEI